MAEPLKYKASSGRAVLTLAIGQSIYFEMACDLARSFLLWNRDGIIDFVIVTNMQVSLPPDLEQIAVRRLRGGECAEGFISKLYLDKFAPAEETLFLDADSLVFGDLTPVFDRFNGHDVSVIGRLECEGELFGDIRRRCEAVGVPAVPRFCGGLYFLRRTEVARAVFATARDLQKRYDELGLKRLRGTFNEEPLIGLAMAVHNQFPVTEDGTIKAEPMFFSRVPKADLFSGKAILSNVSHRPKPYPNWQMPAVARPIILHFNCSFADVPPYTTEVARLRKVCCRGWPIWIATIWVTVTGTIPFMVMHTAKKVLRPMYRYIFGVRPVRRSRRIGAYAG